MLSAGPAFFFDGVTTARRKVDVELTPDALRIQGADGTVLAEWPYGELETVSAPLGVLRLGKMDNPVLARLEVRDATLASAIEARSPQADRSGTGDRRMQAKVIGWSLAAAVSLVGVGVWGVPLIATELTPLIPHALERRLGAAVDRQVRLRLDTHHTGAAFECGNTELKKPGRAAFNKLMSEIEAAADLPIPLTARLVRQWNANAIALPGGYIYVFEGLLAHANSPDELAGVIAHEVGHVAHRDGTRTVLQSAGLSLLFGFLLGDFVGGGAVVFAAKVILHTSYSRAVENAADLYAVAIIDRIGGDPRGLARLLARIDGRVHPGPKLLLDHPETRDRVALIEKLASNAPPRPLLDQSEWAALKSICAGA